MDLFKVKQKPMASTAVGFIYIPFCVLASIAIESGESLTRCAQSSLIRLPSKGCQSDMAYLLDCVSDLCPRDGQGGPKLQQKGFLNPPTSLDM